MLIVALSLFGAWELVLRIREARRPWLVPPLHARFLGAVYLSAALMLGCGLLARRQFEVRIMILLFYFIEH